jgi:hypothetical protein
MIGLFAFRLHLRLAVPGTLLHRRGYSQTIWEREMQQGRGLDYEGWWQTWTSLDNEAFAQEDIDDGAALYNNLQHQKATHCHAEESLRLSNTFSLGFWLITCGLNGFISISHGERKSQTNSTTVLTDSWWHKVFVLFGWAYRSSIGG